MSEDFLSNDLKSVNISQPTSIIDPKLTFLDKFLEKKLQRKVVKGLINQRLIPPDAVKTNTFTLKFNELSNTQLVIFSEAIHNELCKSGISQNLLSPQSIQSIPTTSLIPTDFMGLLESEVFSLNSKANSMNLRFIREKLWEDFARWAYFSIGPNFRKQFQDHCHRLWFKIEHAYQYLNNQNNLFEEQKIFQTNPQDKLYIAEEITKRVAQGIDLKGYLHIFDPQCFKNAFEETLVDFFDLTNPLAVKETQMVVNQYYDHTRTHSSHQSKNFAKGLIEHFGGFTDSNNEPYTTANTVSGDRQEHLECVKKLIKGLQPLSNAVNDYFNNTYPVLYAKMKKLDLGPNVPKSFGAFPTVAINFNVISQFHRDLKDHRNTLCVVCPLGIFEGGELVFPELRLVVHVKQGYGVAFQSNLLIHGNLPVTVGMRHSVVSYIHNTAIKQKRPFRSLFDDCEINVNSDNNLDDSSPKYLPPMLSSGNSSIKPKNHQRSHIGMYNLNI
jgi:hypothetical protein